MKPTSRSIARKLSARALILQQLKVDAARTTVCLEGTAFLDRNRAAFERSLNARATATATVRAAAEARLSHTKRVDRSSTFVSDAAANSAPAQCVFLLTTPVNRMPSCYHTIRRQRASQGFNNAINQPPVSRYELFHVMPFLGLAVEIALIRKLKSLGKKLLTVGECTFTTLFQVGAS